METLAFTSMSSRGQVVIPQEVRDALQMVDGTKFAVTGHGDVILLKRVEVRSIDGLDDLLKRTRAFAKEAGITKQDVRDAIRRARRS